VMSAALQAIGMALEIAPASPATSNEGKATLAKIQGECHLRVAARRN